MKSVSAFLIFFPMELCILKNCEKSSFSFCYFMGSHGMTKGFARRKLIFLFSTFFVRLREEMGGEIVGKVLDFCAKDDAKYVFSLILSLLFATALRRFSSSVVRLWFSLLCGLSVSLVFLQHDFIHSFFTILVCFLFERVFQLYPLFVLLSHLACSSFQVTGLLLFVLPKIKHFEYLALTFIWVHLIYIRLYTNVHGVGNAFQLILTLKFFFFFFSLFFFLSLFFPFFFLSFLFLSFPSPLSFSLFLPLFYRLSSLCWDIKDHQPHKKGEEKDDINFSIPSSLFQYFWYALPLFPSSLPNTLPYHPTSPTAMPTSSQDPSLVLSSPTMIISLLLMMAIAPPVTLVTCSPTPGPLPQNPHGKGFSSFLSFFLSLSPLSLFPSLFLSLFSFLIPPLYRHLLTFVPILTLYVLFEKFLPFSYVKTLEYLDQPFVYRVGYYLISAYSLRLKFYFVWTVAESSCTAARVGYPYEVRTIDIYEVSFLALIIFSFNPFNFFFSFSCFLTLISQLETTNSAPDFTKFWNMSVVRFLNVFTRKRIPSFIPRQFHSSFSLNSNPPFFSSFP